MIVGVYYPKSAECFGVMHINESGFTYVEVVVSGLILVISSIGVSSIIYESIRNQNDSVQNYSANLLANDLTFCVEEDVTKDLDGDETVYDYISNGSQASEIEDFSNDLVEYGASKESVEDFYYVAKLCSAYKDCPSFYIYDSHINTEAMLEIKNNLGSYSGIVDGSEAFDATVSKGDYFIYVWVFNLDGSLASSYVRFVVSNETDSVPQPSDTPIPTAP